MLTPREARGEGPSRRSLLLVPAFVSGLAGACVLLVWLLTRAPAGAVPTTSHIAADGPVGSDEPHQARAGREAEPSPQARATAETRPELIVTPLFDGSARFEPLEAATLRFRAQSADPAGAAIREGLAVSVFHMPDGREARLPVREIGGGVYEALFVPQEQGQFVLTVAAREKQVRSAYFVSLTVMEAAGATATVSADGVGRPRDSASRSGRLVGAAARRGR